MEKWTEDAVYDIFSRMLKVAEDDDVAGVLLTYKTHVRAGLPDKVPRFRKRDIQDAIISRVNRGAGNLQARLYIQNEAIRRRRQQRAKSKGGVKDVER